MVFKTSSVDAATTAAANKKTITVLILNFINEVLELLKMLSHDPQTLKIPFYF